MELDKMIHQSPSQANPMDESTVLISPNRPAKPTGGLGGALAPQLRFRLAVAAGGDVLAALHRRVSPRGLRARWLLHVLHFHLLVVDPQVRGSQVLLAALPFPGAVGCAFPGAKKIRLKLSRSNIFPLRKTERLTSSRWRLSKEPLGSCPSKDSSYQRGPLVSGDFSGHFLRRLT